MAHEDESPNMSQDGKIALNRINITLRSRTIALEFMEVVLTEYPTLGTPY